MVLSEKIVELRKIRGLSQEQLGDKLGVKRKTIFKWEMAKATPDRAQIAAMADIFGVPEDFMLKDEYDMSFIEHKIIPVASSGEKSNVISLEEAQEYIREKRKSAKRVVLAIMVFFLSPISGIFLTVTDDFELGIISAFTQVLFLLAVAILIILAVFPMSKYKHFKSSDAKLASGVRGVIEEYKKKYEHSHSMGILLGIGLMVFSIIPLMICVLLTSNPLAKTLLLIWLLSFSLTTFLTIPSAFFV